jgi:competence protein ComEA
VRALASIIVYALLTSGVGRAAAKAVEGAVNLNTAPPEILALLPGVGPAKAQSILAYRRRHPFRTVDELVRIMGIGRKMVRRLRPHLAVAGPTTASAIDARTAPPPVPPPPPTPPKHSPGQPLCARPPARPTRPTSRLTMPTHGACPPPP